MEKWEVDVSFIVVAPERSKAMQIAREICDEKLKGVAIVKSVSLGPALEPKKWIAINE